MFQQSSELPHPALGPRGWVLLSGMQTTSAGVLTHRGEGRSSAQGTDYLRFRKVSSFQRGQREAPCFRDGLQPQQAPPQGPGAGAGSWASGCKSHGGMGLLPAAAGAHSLRPWGPSGPSSAVRPEHRAARRGAKAIQAALRRELGRCGKRVTV